MVNSVALLGGFTWILVAVLSSSGDTDVDDTLSSHATPAEPSPTVGRIAYLSAPIDVVDDGEGGSSFSAGPDTHGGRWQVVFEGNLRETVAGSHAALLEAARQGQPIAVRMPTFHGFVITQCVEAYETTDGDVGCEVQFWCDGPGRTMIPARHKHIALVRSNGEVQQAVAVHNERDEERIVQVGFTTGNLTWYTE